MGQPKGQLKAKAGRLAREAGTTQLLKVCDPQLTLDISGFVS